MIVEYKITKKLNESMNNRITVIRMIQSPTSYTFFTYGGRRLLFKTPEKNVSCKCPYSGKKFHSTNFLSIVEYFTFVHQKRIKLYNIIIIRARNCMHLHIFIYYKLKSS